MPHTSSGFVGCQPDKHGISYDADEYEQGAFLHHRAVTTRGSQYWSILSWWDRCQGDTRGACNSNLVVEESDLGNGGGRRVLTTAEMLATLSDRFPHVVANLAKYGVTLIEAGTAP